MMQSASFSSTKKDKSVKKRSSKTPAKGAEGKDSDIVQSYEQSLIDVMQSESEQSLIADNISSMCGEDQTFGQSELKDVNEYLKGKVGADINAKKWLEGCEGLDEVEKSEVIIRLVYEVCLAKNIEYDLENDTAENEKGNKKDRNFDTRRIFEILKKVNRLLLPQDRRRLVEFVCQKGNVKLLEMICQQENKDGGSQARINQQYLWKGEFTGYERLTDLLQYVLKQPCSPEIVLCIAKKVYGNAHILCNGEQYLQVENIKRNFDYPDSVIEDCLKIAIELGYKDVVPVMLGGDIYHCIRLMKGGEFKEGKKALEMIEETVAEVMSSWVNDERQSFKDDVQRLLKEGIEIDVEKMDKKGLIDELEYQGIEFSRDDKRSQKRLVEKLRKEGGGKVRLSKTAVGGLISTLFFNYRDELMEKPFELGISQRDESRRGKEINELNEKIDSKNFVKEKVLEKIKLLNTSSHASNGWFFREVLSAIVNDEEKFNKLMAVCIAICKEKVEELLRDVEVHEDVIDALKIFGVEPNQTSTPKNGHSKGGIVSHFAGDIENLVKGIRELNDPSLMVDEVLEIAEGLSGNKVPAFSGLSRRTIINLKNKRDKTKDEAKDLKEKVLKIMGEIKQGIDILADGEYHTDIEDIFRHFRIINSEIEKEDKREIVELVCQKGNVKLLEMICQQENRDRGGDTKIEKQYPWKGEFTGYERLTDLLQYVLKQGCSSEIVLCIAKKVYGNAHIIYNGEQYLDDIQVTRIKVNFDYPDSVIKDCLKTAIELGYKDVVPVMLGGDIYHCIRLMKGEKFQEEKKVLKMIEETVAEVMSLGVNDEGQSFKDGVQRLLKEGIEVDVEKMGKKDLIDELESQGIEVKDKNNTTQKELVKMLEKGERGKVRLSKTVVGGLILALCFNHQDELMEKPFELGISQRDKSRREKEINELNEKIDSKSFVKEKVLKKIKLLNSSSHMKNDWFFREVLSAIVNDEERFNKLKAVCTAICKEPMERLLKGEKVHKDVVDTLKFFGVDPLALDKSNVVASSIPLLQVSSPALPGSKAAEKNNKGFMQNNYGRGGKSYYNTGIGSSRYYLNIQNSCRMVGMHSLQQGGVLNKIRSKQRGSLKKKPSDDRLPKISYLEDAHYERYKKVLLNKIFNYNKFIDPSMLLQEDPSTGMDRSSWSSSSSTSPVTSPSSLNDSRNKSYEDDPYLDGMQDYIEGFELLKKGDENRAKNKIREAANKEFECGMYAYAIIKFKEAMEGHTTKNMLGVDCAPQEAVKEAVKCMIKSGTSFFPLSSFVLGIMELYNVGNHREVIQLTSQKSWKLHFADVLRSTKGIPLSSSIVESNLLGLIGADNLDFTEPNNYLEMVGKEEGMKELELMVEQVKYELAKEMVSNKKELVTAGHLFRQLSNGSFIDAQYSYAVALFNGRLNQVEKEKEVYSLLSKAARCKHPEAMLLLGILPFKKGYEFVKSNNYWSYLENYINLTFDGKDLRQNYLKEKVSVFVAHEYINKNSTYVQYDEQKARDILQRNCDKNQLEKLEKAIKEGKECSQSLLNEVLNVLKHVVCILQNDGELYAQKLSSMLEQLRQELKSSKTTIQQSQDLLLALQQLGSISSIEKRSFLSLQKLYEALEEEVKKQSHCSSQKKILQLLGNLDEVCSALRKERSSSSIGTTSNSTVQLLHTEPVKDKSKSMSDVFVNSQLSALQGHSTPLSSRCKDMESPSFSFDTVSSSTGQPLHTETVEGGRGTSESRDRGSILKGLQEIRNKIEDYDIKNEGEDYDKVRSGRITNTMEKMWYLLLALRKEGELKELLERQQEQTMPQEDVEPLHSIKELISIFKDHVGHASLIRALGPLTEIERCLKGNNSPCNVSKNFMERLLSVVVDCESLSLFANSGEELQDHSTSDLGYSMSKFCDDEMFDDTLSNSRSLLRAKHMVKNEGTSKEGINFVDCTFSSGISSFSEDVFQHARRMSRLFVHNGPSEDKSSPISFERAQKCLEKGDSDSAIKIYDDIVNRESLSGYKNQVTLKALYNTAILFLREHKYSNAEEKFQEILTDVGLHNTDALHLVRNLASALFGQHKYDSALKKLQEVLDIHEEKLSSDHSSIVLIKNDIKEIQCCLDSSTSSFASGSTAFLNRQNISETDRGGWTPHLSANMMDDSGTQDPTYTAMCDAIESNNLAEFKRFVNENGNIEEVDRDNNTFLHLAAKAGKDGMLKDLVSMGISINSCNSGGSTPLCVAIENRRVSAAQQLIKIGADIHRYDNNHNTPLHLAMENGYKSIVRTLGERGANFNFKNKAGQIPLDLNEPGRYSEDIKGLHFKYMKQLSGVSDGDKTTSSHLRLDSAFGGAKQKQNLGNLQQNVPKMKGLGKDKSVPGSSQSSSGRSFEPPSTFREREEKRRNIQKPRGSLQPPTHAASRSRSAESNPVEPLSTFREREEKRRNIQKPRGSLQPPTYAASRSRSAESNPKPEDERRCRVSIKPKEEENQAIPRVGRGK